MTSNTSQTYIKSSRPTRFENLWDGSFFTIVAEPSRNIRKSQDVRIYQKAFDGFYAEHPSTGAACCLMPHDIVQPMKLVGRKAVS